MRVRTRALIHRNANEMINVWRPPQMPNIASDVCDHLVRVPLRYVEQRARVSSRRSHVAPEVEPQPSLHVSVHTSVLNRRNVNEMNYR